MLNPEGPNLNCYDAFKTLAQMPRGRALKRVIKGEDIDNSVPRFDHPTRGRSPVQVAGRFDADVLARRTLDVAPIGCMGRHDGKFFPECFLHGGGKQDF